ncbi:hypothetical protein [Pseudomonas sp.]|uniref:hypothetical protein n=1 Tax=Pseudomonas sp. TaxID=306 RepID=UPI003D14AF3E
MGYLKSAGGNVQRLADRVIHKADDTFDNFLAINDRERVSWVDFLHKHRVGWCFEVREWRSCFANN